MIGNPLLLGDEGGYNLTRSLRFRSSASAYLSRTPPVASNRKTWTFSFWFKRGKLGAAQALMDTRPVLSDSQATNIYINSSDVLLMSGYSLDWRITNQVFRDPAAWYHCVIALDTTQATASNRIKIYINGSQITSFSTSNDPSLNADLGFNQAALTGIGSLSSGATYLDGYLAEVNFIDGQALAPTAFGAFSSYNQWLPKKYAGTYGTNGFYLPFTNNASTTTLGYDFSPQGNNWTTNNISVTAGSTYDSMTDVPTLTSATAANYAVLNPLDKGTTITVQSGNLEASISTTHNGVRNTFQVPTTGKWYWEITNGSTTGSNVILSFGLATSVASMNTYDYNTTGTYSLYASTNLQIISNGSGGITFGSAISSGTVCGIAYDATNGQLYLAVANTYYNSAGSGTGDPAGGTNATMAVASSLGLFPYEHIYADTFNANFGQRPFTYTPPSGYVALNTFNL